MRIAGLLRDAIKDNCLYCSLAVWFSRTFGRPVDVRRILVSRLSFSIFYRDFAVLCCWNHDSALSQRTYPTSAKTLWK